MTCGVASVGLAGAWFVAGSVVRDLAALNKREMLPWDYWGIARELRPGVSVSAATATRLDAVAALTANQEPHWEALREIYEPDAALRVPAVVLSFPGGAPIEVAVPI